MFVDTFVGLISEEMPYLCIESNNKLWYCWIPCILWNFSSYFFFNLRLLRYSIFNLINKVKSDPIMQEPLDNCYYKFLLSDYIHKLPWKIVVGSLKKLLIGSKWNSISNHLAIPTQIQNQYSWRNLKFCVYTHQTLFDYLMITRIDFFLRKISVL